MTTAESSVFCYGDVRLFVVSFCFFLALLPYWHLRTGMFFIHSPGIPMGSEEEVVKRSERGPDVC